MVHRAREWAKNGLIIIYIFSLMPYLATCGKISDPLPPEREMPKPIIDLAATEENNAVVLKWSILDKRGSPSRIRIMRHNGDKGEPCPRCDQNYIVIADHPLMDDKLIKDQNGISPIRIRM